MSRVHPIGTLTIQGSKNSYRAIALTPVTSTASGTLAASKFGRQPIRLTMRAATLF
jgi:hypothetical protein